MVKVRVTGSAADQNGFAWPGCEALTEQLPLPVMVSVVPLTEQAPVVL